MLNRCVKVVLLVFLVALSISLLPQQAQAAEVKLAWDYPTNVTECAKFSAYKSKADGTIDWIARIGQTANCTAPTEATPFVLQLQKGTYKLWVVPVDVNNDPIADAETITVTAANPKVANLRQVS